jgi:phosphoglycolate phosphatase-like HAD superfamily hydrolase
MDIALIFDLDLTLINSKIAEKHRNSRNWNLVYETIPSFTPYEGMDDVLEFISKNEIPVAIVTSSPSSYCKKVCTHWNLRVAEFVCYHDTTRKKPHPEPILKAVQRLGMPAERILSFGDRAIDIEASNSARTKSVACLWGTEENELLISAKPAFILETPNQIIGLIKEFKDGL